MLMPGGSPVADQVRVSPSGSVAVIVNDTTSPSPKAWAPGSSTTGSRFTFVTVHVNVSNASFPGGSEAVMVTAYGEPDAAV